MQVFVIKINTFADLSEILYMRSESSSLPMVGKLLVIVRDLITVAQLKHSYTRGGKTELAENLNLAHSEILYETLYLQNSP